MVDWTYRAEEWQDEDGEWRRTCANCWCSLSEGEEHRIETCSEPGRCGGCGRYGTYGKACFRMLDGQMEECGQFV